MDQDTRFFVYYYFLGRKYGWPPYACAEYAIEWALWWRKKDNPPALEKDFWFVI